MTTALGNSERHSVPFDGLPLQATDSHAVAQEEIVMW